MPKQKLTTRMLAAMGVLVALEVVIARFGTIRPSESLKLSVDFIPVVVAGMLYGPVPAMVISMLADVLGAFLFPVGPYFPGFTLTAALTGLLYGALLRPAQTMPRVALAVLLQQGVLSLLLNTFWLELLYGMPYLPTLVGRLAQCAILATVQLIFIPAFAKLLPKLEKGVGA